MLNKIEDFFMNHLLGKLSMTAGASIAAFLASGKLGASVQVDPVQMAALVGGLANLALDFIQHYRQPVAASKAAGE